jgi:putative redox protein
MSERPASEYREVKASTAQGAFGQTVEIGPHRFPADEPPFKGGNDAGPAPHEWVLAGLASCVAMTVQGYAKHKGLALRNVEVRVSSRRENGVFIIERQVELDGDLDDAQRARLLEIAGRCPVTKTLTGEIRIVSRLSE